MKKLLVLGAPVFQIEVIKKAKEMGLYVGVVDVNKDAPAFPFADEKYVSSIKDYDSVLDIAQDFKPDGILIGACDTSVVTGAKICKAMRLPGNSIETAIMSTNKVEMLNAFELHGVAHPKFQVVKKEAIEDFVCSIQYPIISKPIDSAGGRGVCIVHSDEELEKAVRFSSSSGVSGDILLEEYMRGPEVSVEVLVVDGKPYVLQITDKITSGEPNFYEIGHSQPSTLSEGIKEEIKRLACKAVLAVGIKNSPAHVEIIITESGPKMVELGARLGGDCITSYLIDASISGINMIEAAIELSLGIKPNVSKYENSGMFSGVRFIPAKEGKLISITGSVEAESMPGVTKLFIMGKIGKEYSNATDDSARFGYVVCTGSSKEEALLRCQNAVDRINFEIELV